MEWNIMKHNSANNKAQLTHQNNVSKQLRAAVVTG